MSEWGGMHCELTVALFNVWTTNNNNSYHMSLYCPQDLVADYMCECETGWEGKSCEINHDDCDPDPCDNGDCEVHTLTTITLLEGPGLHANAHGHILP